MRGLMWSPLMQATSMRGLMRGPSTRAMWTRARPTRALQMLAGVMPAPAPTPSASASMGTTRARCSPVRRSASGEPP